MRNPLDRAASQTGEPRRPANRRGEKALRKGAARSGAPSREGGARSLGEALAQNGVRFVAAEQNRELVEELRRQGAGRPQSLRQRA